MLLTEIFQIKKYFGNNSYWWILYTIKSIVDCRLLHWMTRSTFLVRNYYYTVLYLILQFSLQFFLLFSNLLARILLCDSRLAIVCLRFYVLFHCFLSAFVQWLHCQSSETWNIVSALFAQTRILLGYNLQFVFLWKG